MRTFLATICSLAVGLLLAAGQVAQADVLQFDFTGNVILNVGNPLGITSPVGTPVNGTFSYNTTAADINASPQIGTYVQPLPNGIGMTIGANLINGLNGAVDVGNNAPFDYFNYSSGAFNNVNGVQRLNSIVGVALVDLSGTVFTSDSLPTNLNLANFTAGIGYVIDTNTGAFLLFALNSLTQHTPEPASIAVWSMIGVAGVMFGRRRRAKAGQNMAA